MTSRLRRGHALAEVDLSQGQKAPGAMVTHIGKGLSIVTPPAEGAYAAAIPLSHADSDPADAYVEIDAVAAEGSGTFLLATADMKQMVGAPASLTPGQAGPSRSLVQRFREASWLLVRNDGADGRPAMVNLQAVRFFAAEPETLPEIADVGEGRMGSVDIAGLAAVADAVENPDAPLVIPTPIVIDAVPVELLGSRLGFPTGFDPAKASRKPLTAWRMEDDDQQIFRYLYHQAQPRRHLEFGTWLGAGTVYCLEECGATVWTINLLEGERQAGGDAAYDGRSDSGADIGRLYLEAGLGNRVCQIFSDSMIWDTRNYPPGFFDSVLIDGGHQAEVVVSDTLRAIELLRPGGICMWHDFAPDPAVFGVSPATIGVAKGIRAVWPSISEAMQDVFYIWPSQILVGVRR